MAIKVILADDHNIVRDGLKALLEKQPQVTVIGEASNGREVVELVRKLQPDVVILDIGMPDLNGIEATRQISSESPAVKVLALSMHADRRFVTRMLGAGAAGYLLKDCAFEELAKALQTVMSEQIYLSPNITSQVVKEYIRRYTVGDAHDGPLLTPRECEVIQLLAEGRTTKDVASQLSVSVKTVETHRSQIMQKLDIHSVAQLTKYAIREGLTSLEG